MRVLLSAYACAPDRGSEPYVGWTWARSIARFAEVHVLTQGYCRPLIERALQREPLENVNFHYFDPPGWTAGWESGGRALRLHAYLWQLLVSPVARALHSRYAFDVVHHLTFAGLSYPPGVAVLDAPFLWGPVGGLRSPDSLRAALRPAALLEERVHDVALAASRVNPLTRRAARTARTVLALPRTMLPPTVNGRAMATGNIFIDTSVVRPPPERGMRNGTLRIVSLMRMLYLKGGDLGLEALMELRRRGVSAEWTLVGDGPERARWECLARELGLAPHVRFTGWRSRAGALEELGRADVLLHPSFREGWSGAVLEAMSAAIPVVCLDWGGPGHIVGHGTGIAVPVNGTRAGIIDGIADALERLRDPVLRADMGESARQRARAVFSIDGLDRTVERIYEGLDG